ncbi:unnamed protein product [Discula destructiva]
MEGDPNCFTKTRDAFLSSLSAAGPTTSKKVTADDCKALAAIGDGGQLFFALYELDKTYCGLGPIKTTGDDPTINSILTNCSSQYGVSNLVDPGWPSSTYQCTLCTSTQQTQIATPSRDASTASTSAPPVTKVAAGSQSLSPSSEISSSTTWTRLSTESTSTTAPSLASHTSPSNKSFIESTKGRLPTQGIVAIAVCVTIAIAAAAILLFCVLRRRRKQQAAMQSGSSSRSSRITSAGNSPRGNTYEPLRSPSHSISGEAPPLTPPPRLRDRKLLIPSPSRSDESLAFGKSPFETTHHQHSSSSLYSPAHSLNAKHDVSVVTSTAPAGRDLSVSSFPSSPICAPRDNKLEPRQERMQVNVHARTPMSPEFPPPPSSPPCYTRLKSPPPVSFTFPPRSSLDNNNTDPSRSPPLVAPAAKKSRHRRGTTAATRSSSNHNNGNQPYSPTTSASDASSAFGSSGQAYRQHHQQHGSVTSDPRAFLSSPTPPPCRPRRPHDEPLEIPDLVRPASPVFAAAPVIGLAQTTPSISLQSLGERQYQHHDRKDSWGSWEGGREEDEPAEAGRMFGVSFPPVHGK